MQKIRTLRLIMGDQLNENHSWYNTIDDSVMYVMMEIRTETDYAKHHIQKILGFFTAMQNFANGLKANGHHVQYVFLNDASNLQSFEGNLNAIIKKEKIKCFEYQLPDEYRVDENLKQFCKVLAIDYKEYDTEHFLTTRTYLGDFFEGKKTFLMESFYRALRKKYNILMDGDKPYSGQWNYDGDNRKKLPAKHLVTPPLLFNNDLSAILKEVNKTNIKYIGTVDAKHFLWPTSREQSLQLLQFFVQQCLPLFGTYEDAMTPTDWSLYHSRLSFCMNTKMLSPLEVINKVIETWQANQKEISYNQVEGFVRQILGWREYMRGIYWLKMPEYASLNYFEHTNKLPNWYWTGNTKMKCLSHSINQSLEYAYAHHIQRLMVTGNFALLAGVHPDAVDEWYLGIYIDALDWVEITNTRGMSQFADGGIVGSKPYVSSANYIDKMSHYCNGCYYNKAVKTGDKACPFNSLYWNFYSKHEAKLAKNPRIGMVYNVWHKMPENQKVDLLNQADFYLKNINDL